jgi:hypothetical protein
MHEIPLTNDQRMWLRLNVILPTSLMAIVLMLFTGLFLVFFRSLPSHPMIRGLSWAAAALLVLVLLGVAYHVRNNRLDLARGTASVAIVRLLRKTTGNGSRHTFHAHFDSIGRVVVGMDQYERLTENETYRVTFSPRTRKGWEVASRW